jgi:hypothetical protein
MKKGETKVFNTLQDFAEKHPYTEGEFQFINHQPLTLQKVQ